MLRQATVALLLASLTTAGCSPASISLVKPLTTYPVIAVATFGSCEHLRDCPYSGVRVSGEFVSEFGKAMSTETGRPDSVMFGSRISKERLAIAKKKNIDYIIEGDVTYVDDSKYGGKRLDVDLQVVDTADGSVALTQKASKECSYKGSIEAMAHDMAAELMSAIGKPKSTSAGTSL